MALNQPQTGFYLLLLHAILAQSQQQAHATAKAKLPQRISSAGYIERMQYVFHNRKGQVGTARDKVLKCKSFFTNKTFC